MKSILSLALTISLAAILANLVPTTQAATTPAKAKTAKAASAPVKRPGIAKDPYVGAILVDAVSRNVLFEDHADAQAYPASVLKLMDVLILIEKIEQKQLSLQDQVVVSPKAAKTGGSQVWLADKEVFTVDELLYALMIQSANDAAVALAEKAAGSTEAFVALMNQRAQALGMTHTLFQSVHGLPPGVGQQPDVSTPRDFAILCLELLKHPDVLRYTSTLTRPFRPNAGDKTVIMRNHNHLLTEVAGCDGFKTGYFTKAGYSIAATAARPGQRVIAIVMGSGDRKVRDAKAAELLAKGFAKTQPAKIAPMVPVTVPIQPLPAPVPVKK
jgi:serine-type D-Ala-D-Ala carboxypeptidase (penicillin-binding protein 5/6)